MFKNYHSKLTKSNNEAAWTGWSKFLFFFFTFFSLLSFGEVNAASVTYTYDKLNRISTAVYPDGSTITYSYNTVGTLVTKAVSVPSPTITSFTPTSATSGDTVTITGNSFSGATAVSFGGTAATSFTVDSDTQISAVIGSGSSGNVGVTTPGGTITKTGFTFISPSTITFLKSSPSNIIFNKIGGSKQLTITAEFSNGITLDVTASSTFTSSKSAVATVSAGGLVTAVADGTADITAAYVGKSVIIPVKVDGQNNVSEFPRAELLGVPQGKVSSDRYTCNITVGGTGVTAYRYSFGGKPFSSEILVSTKITNELTPGTHVLSVVGKDGTGRWQPLKEATIARWFQEPKTPSNTPVISVSPMTLDFGDNLEELKIYVSNIGSGTATWSMAAGKSWISLKSGSGSTTGEVDVVIVKVRRSGLAAGTHVGAIILTDGAGAKTTIGVAVTVSSQPVLRVNPLSIHMGGTKTQKKIVISNTGGGSMSWTATLDKTNYPWADLDVTSGTVAAGGTTAVLLTVDRTKMNSVGRNSAAMVFADGSGNSVTVNITAYKPDSTVTVSSMTTNPSNLDADGKSTSSVTATFTNCANQAVIFTTNLGSFNSASSITVTSDLTGLATATYMASIIPGIATIKAICRGVFGVGSINLGAVPFRNAETIILGPGSVPVNQQTTTGLSMDKSGNGTPAVTLAVYSSNPGGSGGFAAIGSHFDVHLDDTEDIDSITIKKWVTAQEIAGVDTSTLGLYYLDGTTWKKCSRTGYVAVATGNYVGYIYATFTTSTTPDITYLNGLALVSAEGVVAAPAPIPTLSQWGMFALVLLFLMSGALLARIKSGKR